MTTDVVHAERLAELNNVTQVRAPDSDATGEAMNIRKRMGRRSG